MLKVPCVGCHGEQKPRANLRLDSKEAILKGGKDGSMVVSHDSSKSLLVAAAAQIDLQKSRCPPVSVEVAAQVNLDLAVPAALADLPPGVTTSRWRAFRPMLAVLAWFLQWIGWRVRADRAATQAVDGAT